MRKGEACYISTSALLPAGRAARGGGASGDSLTRKSRLGFPDSDFLTRISRLGFPDSDITPGSAAAAEHFGRRSAIEANLGPGKANVPAGSGAQGPGFEPGLFHDAHDVPVLSLPVGGLNEAKQLPAGWPSHGPSGS